MKLAPSRFQLSQPTLVGEITMGVRAKLKVLVIEDSAFFQVVVMKKFIEQTGYEPIWAASLAQAMERLAEHDDFFAAIIDFNLPDAPNGEAIEEVIIHKIPAIVFTGMISEQVRDAIWSHKVVDYFLKTDLGSIDNIISLLDRLRRNRRTKVILTDDSTFFRTYLARLLKVHLFQVLEAANGNEALALLAANPDVRLVITDYNMPFMDGFKLVQEIRKKHGKNNLAIIGVSAEGKHITAARFIKNGANDFIIKQSFLTEEFYVRVNQCLDTMDHIQAVREASIKDFLTGLFNRRYFFSEGVKLFNRAFEQGKKISCAMLDIDFFKKVNDSYGHDGGDFALQAVANILKKGTEGQGLLARFGGEEFALLLDSELEEKRAIALCEELRKKVEEEQIQLADGRTLKITISIGLYHGPASHDLDWALNEADVFLFQAKKNGRNQTASA